MAPLTNEFVLDVILALEPGMVKPSSPVLVARRKRSHPISLVESPRLNATKLYSSTSVLHNIDTNGGELDDKISCQEKNRWACQKAILAAHSPYFRAMFLGEFKESWTPIVFLPRHVFSSVTLKGVLHYVHTHTLGFQGGGTTNDPLEKKIDDVEWLQDMYEAADYLCMDELCSEICDRMDTLAHQWICHCRRCQCIVPQLLAFGLGRENDVRIVPLVQRAQRAMTNEPDKVLCTFWTSRTMADLQMQMTRSIQHKRAQPLSPSPSPLSQRLWRRISKCNAIETLYACFCASSALSKSDPLLGWSRPLHATLASAQARATHLIARHFDFFCTQYPALILCIDGISYSYEFLEYLLLHVLEDQMDCTNAGTIYQGLVRDLMCRHVFRRNHQVRHILTVAQAMILQYMLRNLCVIQDMGVLQKLEANVLKSLARDLAVHPRVLTSTSGAGHYAGCRSNGCYGSSLRLLRPLRYSISSTNSTDFGVSRRSSVQTSTTQRTLSSSDPSREEKGILEYIKSWFVDSDGDHGHALRQVRSLCSGAAATVTPFSWTTVPVGKRKSKYSLVRRLFPFLTTCQKQKQKTTYVPAIAVGKRVQLTRRPILTVGTVAYIGNVDFAEGTWVGVELDRRVGKNDGSADGKRYFRTSPNRGVFVRIDDVSLVV